MQNLFEGYCRMPLLWKEKFFGLQQFKEPLNSHIIKNPPLVFENLQIIKEKQTLGELDVLLLDRLHKKYIHLELITKFYLYNPAFEANDIKAWIGPNRNDSLYDKTTKLKEKQLPLLYHQFTQKLLLNYIPEKKNIEQQVCFKANLFVPIGFKEKLTVFNSNCIVGNYLTFIQFKEVHNHLNLYFCPTKQDWLRDPATQKEWMTFDETWIEKKGKSNSEKAVLKKRIAKIIGIVFIVVVLLTSVFFVSIYLGYWGKIPTKKQLTEIQQSKATEVWSEDGKLLGKYYTTDRQPIAFELFPKHLLDALVATEDVRFYEHTGVDKLSMLRVLFKSVLLQNKSSGGGSTLSQQLAKNMFPRRKIGKMGIVVHKVREMIIANRLEEAYTKNQLLTHYLNIVPFSDNTFGIESASLKFFNKSTYQLRLEEAAVLIGMLKTNYYYNPRLFPEKSKSRRNTVLEQMYKYDYITKKTLEKTKELPLEIDYQNFSHNTGLAPYFREHVKQQAKKWLDDYNKDVMQEKAEQSMAKHLSGLQNEFERSYGRSAPWLKPMASSKIKELEIFKELEKQGLSEKAIRTKLNENHEVEVFTWKGKKIITATTMDSLAYYSKFLNTGFVSLEPNTGAIKAWIGGIDFEQRVFSL